MPPSAGTVGQAPAVLATFGRISDLPSLVAASGPVHGWDGTGALTPINPFATMFSGMGIQSTDGTEWYFPQRLTDDTGAVANGNANPAQSVLDVHATMGQDLPHNLRIYAFGAHLGGQGVLHGPATGPAIQYPRRQPDVDQPPEHLRPQRPGRRLLQQRLLQEPGSVPEESRRSLTVDRNAGRLCHGLG